MPTPASDPGTSAEWHPSDHLRCDRDQGRRPLVFASRSGGIKAPSPPDIPVVVPSCCAPAARFLGTRPTLMATPRRTQSTRAASCDRAVGPRPLHAAPAPTAASPIRLPSRPSLQTRPSLASDNTPVRTGDRDRRKKLRTFPGDETGAAGRAARDCCRTEGEGRRLRRHVSQRIATAMGAPSSCATGLGGARCGNDGYPQAGRSPVRMGAGVTIKRRNSAIFLRASERRHSLSSLSSRRIAGGLVSRRRSRRRMRSEMGQ